MDRDDDEHYSGEEEEEDSNAEDDRDSIVEAKPVTKADIEEQLAQALKESPLAADTAELKQLAIAAAAVFVVVVGRSDGECGLRVCCCLCCVFHRVCERR